MKINLPRIGTKINLQRIALITMCTTLALTVILSAVVIGKASPMIQMLVGGNPQPSQPPATVQPTQTEPPDTNPPDTQPPTVEPTDPTKPQPTTPSGHTHAFRLKETVEATCDQEGYSVYVCSCGASEMRDYVAAKKHSYGPGKLVSPTCTEEGYTEATCSICGHVEVRDRQDALGHDYQMVRVQEGNCTEDGYTEYKCSRCGDVKREDVQVAPGHDFSEWEITREPTAGDPGERTRECSVCHEKEKTVCETRVDPQKSEDRTYNDYIITLKAKDSHGQWVEVFTYEVQDYGKHDLHFKYEEKSGMTVSFTTASGTAKDYPLRPGEKLILGEDGNQKPVTPQPTDPSEPTQPSEPTDPTDASQPTEQSEPTDPSAPTEAKDEPTP